MDKKKVLLIDDEKAFSTIISKSLEDTGEYEVDIAINGTEGFKKAKHIKPDIIVLDIQMPGMDGFETLDKLKGDKDTLAIPVVMLSALNGHEFKTKTVQKYGEIYVEKTVNFPELRKKLETVLRDLS